MSSIRIVVKIPTGTYPELVADLARVATRQRAERLRVLAMIGLRDLRESQSRNQAPSCMPPTTAEGPSERKGAASTIIRKLVQGL